MDPNANTAIVYCVYTVVDEATGELLKYIHLIKGPDKHMWQESNIK